MHEPQTRQKMTNTCDMFGHSGTLQNVTNVGDRTATADTVSL